MQPSDRADLLAPVSVQDGENFFFAGRRVGGGRPQQLVMAKVCALHASHPFWRELGTVFGPGAG